MLKIFKNVRNFDDLEDTIFVFKQGYSTKKYNSKDKTEYIKIFNKLLNLLEQKKELTSKIISDIVKA